MLMWNGACIVHDEFRGLELQLLREQYPDALILVHPESPQSVVAQADVVGSTSALIKAVVEGTQQRYVVATDNGILHRMRQLAPGKELIEAPTAGNGATCKSCAHCPWMAMNALTNLITVLETGTNAVTLDETVRAKAQACITRMLDFTAARKAATATTPATASGMTPGMGAA
jgi:quinolinate synthase